MGKSLTLVIWLAIGRICAATGAELPPELADLQFVGFVPPHKIIEHVREITKDKLVLEDSSQYPSTTIAVGSLIPGTRFTVTSLVVREEKHAKTTHKLLAMGVRSSSTSENFLLLRTLDQDAPSEMALLRSGNTSFLVGSYEVFNHPINSLQGYKVLKIQFGMLSIQRISDANKFEIPLAKITP